MHIDGIAANAGIDLAVAQDRDIEPVMRVGPDIEIRGVVSSEVNIISQYFRPAHGADQQIRGICRGIFRVLLPLVGNRSDDALHIGQQIAVARGLLSGKFHLRTIRIVVGIIRRCGRHIEHRYRTRYGKKLHGTQFDVGNGRSNGNVIGDFRHAALYFDGRQRQHPVCRGNYRYIALIGHRQYIVLVGVCNGEILPQQIVAQIAAQIGGNAHPVVARQAFETQRRRGLVTV